jgi:uncharacterized protein (TIGR03437 family)
VHRIKLTLAMLAALCATTTSFWSLTAVKGQSAGLFAPTGVAASDGLGGSNADVSFAGAPESFTGLDQINIAIPRSLAGRGSVDVVARVDGKTTNIITVTIK